MNLLKKKEKLYVKIESQYPTEDGIYCYIIFYIHCQAAIIKMRSMRFYLQLRHCSYVYCFTS